MFGKKEFVSIEMGSNNIKVVMANRKGKSFKVHKAFMVTIPEGAYHDGEIHDNESISERLKSALAMNGVKAKDAIVSINSTNIITREISLPVTKAEEIDSMVHYEMQQYLPIELSQYVVDYKITDEFLDGAIKKNRIVVAAVQKSMVERYLDLLNGIDLNPAVLDTCASSLSKLFGKSTVVNGGDPLGDKTIAVIDMGHRSITVNIISNGAIKLSRIVDEGGFSVDSSLGALQDSESMGRAIDGWILKIQRIFQFYLSRGGMNGIDEIYLYGGTSNLEGINEYMESSFNMPVSTIESLSVLDVAGNIGDFDVKFFLNAIGAAGRDR